MIGKRQDLTPSKGIQCFVKQNHYSPQKSAKNDSNRTFSRCAPTLGQAPRRRSAELRHSTQ